MTEERWREIILRYWNPDPRAPEGQLWVRHGVSLTELAAEENVDPRELCQKIVSYGNELRAKGIKTFSRLVEYAE